LRRGVVIDSLVDLPSYFTTDLPLEVVGFKVYVNGKEYTDGKDISKEKFYEIAASTDDLRTSYPPPYETFQIYKKLEEKGVEEILALHLPAKVSGFLSTIDSVISKLRAKVKVFDTRSLSGGAGLVAAKMIELFEKGITFEELEEFFWDIRKRIFVQFSVSSLKFLIKNGRIGKAKGLIGNMLRILPILTVDEDGEVAPLNKVHGRKKVIDKIVENIEEFVKDRKFELVVGWGIKSAQNNAMKIKEKIFEIFGDQVVKFGTVRISPTVACHSGPDIYGAAVYLV
jgi:DegV family protein with EDD domain